MQGFQDMIQQCLQRNQRAYYQLYQYSFQTMMRISRRYCNNQDDAVDLTNQAFLKVVNHLHTYLINESYEAWLKRITVNTCLDAYRKNKRYRSRVSAGDDMPQTLLDAKATHNNDGWDKLTADDIFQLIDELPDKCREVFNLFAIDGYNHAEIAQLLDMTETTSRWYLHKARGILQQKITTQQSSTLLSHETAK
jgi:RNA polymerase sigma-70 factor (ECF subfamily)